MRYVPLGSHDALTQWQFSPFPLLVLAVAVLVAASGTSGPRLRSRPGAARGA